MTWRSSAEHWNCIGWRTQNYQPDKGDRRQPSSPSGCLSHAGRILCVISIAVGLAITGCRSTPPSGFTDVQSQVQIRTGHSVQCNPVGAGQPATECVVDALLERELTAEQAAQIVLLKNPSLQ